MINDNLKFYMKHFVICTYPSLYKLYIGYIRSLGYMTLSQSNESVLNRIKKRSDPYFASVAKTN